MGKMKESFSPLYYSSQDEFFADVETGTNQPSYVGLIEIVRVLKLISQGRKKAKEVMRQKDFQLSFGASELNRWAGVS